MLIHDTPRYMGRLPQEAIFERVALGNHVKSSTDLRGHSKWRKNQS